jgi:hypothetical protein
VNGLDYVESGPAIYEVYAAGISREYKIVAGAGEHVVVAFTGKDFVVAAAAFDFVVAAATVEAVIPFGPHERIVAVGAGEDVRQGFLPDEERSDHYCYYRERDEWSIHSTPSPSLVGTRAARSDWS